MRISVVIPVLNEAPRLPALIAALAAEVAPADIIVVDGGSVDGSERVAAAAGVTVLRTRPGRGRQLAAGAAAATGDVLLFLHADSRFPSGGLAAIRRRLSEDAALVGGNFRLLFDGDDNFSRWLDGFYAWIRSHGVYYGDSGIFVRRSVHDAIGGVPAIALMEDYAFTRRMEAHGPTACIDTPPLVSSSRRFRGRHPVAIVSGWLVIHALYHMGMPPCWLAAMYGSRRPGRGEDAARSAAARGDHEHVLE